ncbi:MAG: pilus assembly protein [Comamonadaceae bacterium CG17_big_fil_post_rev_8_21_14_2_50_60_13]|nr:MAG: pilus assembly protein [Comamonadaceae bacterium CG17_big_fil_post_rev_8_21_14_2_50_60_13]
MRLARDTLIADSGFLIALFDTREPHHLAAQAFLQHQPRPLVTVDAVLVEVCFFLAGGQRRAFLNAVVAGALPVALPELHSHRRIAELAVKYDDIAPDYADLALIDLAERTNLQAVLTLDARDFLIYRIKGRKSFDLVSWF